MQYVLLFFSLIISNVCDRMNLMFVMLWRAALANRVLYHLDLLGSSPLVDTACSSSLVALHLGVSPTGRSRPFEATADG